MDIPQEKKQEMKKKYIVKTYLSNVHQKSHMGAFQKLPIGYDFNWGETDLDPLLGTLKIRAVWKKQEK